eukprot:1382790-Amorphochlora_amoeboformis.AAC.3
MRPWISIGACGGTGGMGPIPVPIPPPGCGKELEFRVAKLLFHFLLEFRHNLLGVGCWECKQKFDMISGPNGACEICIGGHIRSALLESIEVQLG